jgi:hypothetical protein
MFSTNLVLILYDLPNIQKKRLNPAYPALKSASHGAHKMTELNRNINKILISTLALQSVFNERF